MSSSLVSFFINLFLSFLRARGESDPSVDLDYFYLRLSLYYSRYSAKSNCLDDRPPISAVVKEPKELYGKLPGQVISRDEQCKKSHGQNYFGCPQMRVSNIKAIF